MTKHSQAELATALKFIENLDALKNTYRKCLIMNGERNESTAEHSFSLAMAVMCFAQFSNEQIDINKAVKMALFHDLAEALMGDTFHYDKTLSMEAQTVEFEALKKLLKPIQDTDLHDEILTLWQEFEHGSSAESLFLRGIDRFLPMHHNYKTNGHTWVKYGVSKEAAIKKNQHIKDGSETLWNYTLSLVEDSHSKGWLA